MPNSKIAVITAAGLGSRLGFNLPKCLVKIGGHPILKYQLDLLEDFDQVRVVVGFKSAEVVNLIKKYRRDIIFVNNKKYFETGNIHSAHLAVKDIEEPFFYIDGDLIINKKSFDSFVSTALKCNHSLVGISSAKTEEAVFTEIDNGQVINFCTENKTNYEWSGVAYFNGINFKDRDDGFIYKVLEKHLPLKAHELDLFEIDTPGDYQFALHNFHSLI